MLGLEVMRMQNGKVEIMNGNGIWLIALEVTDAEQPERAPRETENRRLIHRHCQEERACDLD